MERLEPIVKRAVRGELRTGRRSSRRVGGANSRSFDPEAVGTDEVGVVLSWVARAKGGVVPCQVEARVPAPVIAGT